MPTALDNGRRSPRKLPCSVVARLLGRKPRFPHLAHHPRKWSFQKEVRMAGSCARVVHRAGLLDRGALHGQRQRLPPCRLPLSASIGFLHRHAFELDPVFQGDLALLQRAEALRDGEGNA